MNNVFLGKIYQVLTIAISLTTPIILFNTSLSAYPTFWQQYFSFSTYIMLSIFMLLLMCIFVSKILLPSSIAFSFSLWEDIDTPFVNRLKRIETKLDSISEAQNETKK